MTLRPAGRFLATCAAVVVVLAGCSDSSGSSAETPSSREIATVLAEHGKAVLARDRSAFDAGLAHDQRASKFRADQDAEFDNLLTLPLTRWSYTLGPRVDAAQAQAAARRTHGASAVIVRLRLTYALRGADPIPTQRDLWWTFVRSAGQVVITSDSDLAQVGGASWKGPWDFGPLEVVRGASSLVLGHADNAAVLRTVADTVDASVPAVTSVWGTGWSRYVAVVVPSSPDELTAALGPTSTSTAEVAAIAVSDGQDVLSGKVYGQRLVVEAAGFSRLSIVGRRIVIRHEVTHVAAAAATTDATPRWLVEGFADYVGNLRSGQPVAVAASELRADVRHRVLPDALPTDAAFGTSSSAAQAYEGSWLACRLIAERVGQDRLVRFYLLVGASPHNSDDAVAAALRTVLHETPQRFVTRWRAYLDAQLA